MSVSLSLCVTIVSTDRVLAKIKDVLNGVRIFRHLLSNGNIAKIVLRYIDLFFEGQRFESRPSHSGERLLKCDDCEYCCTRSGSIAILKLTHISQRPFKCDDIEFKCFERNICIKADRYQTQYKCARLLKNVLFDSVSFVRILHSIALP